MGSKEDIISRLGDIPIFSEMEPGALEHIAANVQWVTVAPGEIIFSEGSPGDSVNIVVRGSVSIHKDGEILKKLGPSEFFGEMALVDDSPRAAGASAIEETTLLRLDKYVFLNLLEDRADLSNGLVRALSRRLKESNIAIDNLRDFLEKRLLPLGAALSSEKRFDKLLERILSEAKKLCHADGGTIYILRNDCLEFTLTFSDSPLIAAAQPAGGKISFPPLPLYDGQGKPNLSHVATRVAIEGHSINVPDVYRAENFNFSGTQAFDLKTGYHTHSLLTAPLKNHEDQVIGVLQLINALDEKGQTIPFGSYEQLVVESLSSQAAVALNTHLLLDRQRELLVVERDVEVGRQIQSDLLPELLPSPAGWEIDSRFHPAKQVSGDFFDAFMDGQRVGLVVADVCDKGVGAALFMALSRSLLRAFSWLSEGCPLPNGEQGTRLTSALPDLTGEPVRLTNEYIARFHTRMNMFVTLFFGVLDPATGLLRYINAGHNPPLVVGKEGTIKARLAPTGPALGIVAGSDFQVGELILEPGDSLLAFTDGVTEARDPNGGFFTDQRLVTLVEDEVPESATALLERIDNALNQYMAGHGQADDITMLAVRRTPIQVQSDLSEAKAAAPTLAI